MAEEGGACSNDEICLCDLCWQPAQNQRLNAVNVFNTDLIVCTNCLDMKVIFGFQSEEEQAMETEFAEILLAERQCAKGSQTSFSNSRSSSRNDENKDDGDDSVEDVNFSSLNFQVPCDKNDREYVEEDEVVENTVDDENTTEQDWYCAGQSYNLFLIGKTGHGKSSTGNSILGLHAFRNDSSASSVTRDIQAKTCVYNKINITVVDGPGIGDTKYTKEQDIVQAICASSYAMEVSPSGFDAMLLVFSYPLCFTKEEIKTVDIIRALFGRDILRTHGIIIFTHGDNFDIDEDDGDDEPGDEDHRKPKTFEEWCRAQTGKIQLLFEECNHRHVLFNNATQNDQEKNEQINQLLTLCHCLKAEQEPYSLDRYRQSEWSRNVLFVQARQSRIAAITDRKIDSFHQRCLKTQQNQHAKERLQLWSNFLREFTTFQNHLRMEARGTNLLDHIIQKVDKVLSNIASCKEKDQQILERKHRENREARMNLQQGDQIYKDALKAQEESFCMDVANFKEAARKHRVEQQKTFDRLGQLGQNVAQRRLDIQRKDQGRCSSVCIVS